MSDNTESLELCLGCVYYPPNLPPTAYRTEDWTLLQALACSHEHEPGSVACLATRKTSCSIVDLNRR